MGSFIKFVKQVSTTGATIGMFTMLAMMLVLVTSVIMRAAFRIVMNGSYEIVSTLAVIAASAFVIFGAMEESNVVIDVLLNRLSKKVKRILKCIMTVLSMGFLIMMIWSSIDIIIDIIQLTGDTKILKIPLLPFWIIWDIALVLFCLILIIQLYTTIKQGVKD
jgi:TRAP-type transport system small permease protein